MKRQLFEKWLQENTKLLESTITNYLYSISSLSTWAKDELGTDINLYDLSDLDSLNKFIENIENNESFKQQNEINRHRWSASLNFFKKFINGEDYTESDDICSKIKRVYQSMLTEDKLVSKDKLAQGYEVFSKRFSPEVLKTLDGELLLNTLFNVGNRDGLPYWLEFKNDDEFQTSIYGGISTSTVPIILPGP